MIAFFEHVLTTPMIAYLLLSVLFVEAVVLVWLWKAKRAGIPTVQVITFLGAGAAFSLALGSVLAGAGTFWLAACLCLAFVFHILDLKQRWRSE